MIAFPRTHFAPAYGDTAIFNEDLLRLEAGFTEAIVELAPNSGTDLHYHADRVELVEVLLGTLTVQLGDHVFILRPGDAATIPSGSHHRYSNDSPDRAVSLRCTIRQAHTVMVTPRPRVDARA